MFEIGNSLREARLRQGLEFVEVEQATKIRGKYLRALEDEQFDILPGQTYVKGFLRTYAEYLGLDGQLYVDEYNSRYIPGDEETPLRAQTQVDGRPEPASGVQRRADRARRDRRSLTALVVVAWRFGSDTPETAIPDFSSEPPAETRAKQPARRPARPAAPIARVTITGALGDSWVEVHQRTAAGRELYRGTLEAGSTIRFAQRRHARRHGTARKSSAQGERACRGGTRPRQHDGSRDHCAPRHPGSLSRLSHPTAVVLVTGSELVRGGRTDENGPFLARELSTRGIEPERVLVVGDRPEGLEAAFRESLGAGLVVTSGGLGPTHDDRTVETLARVAGRELVLDPALEREIGGVVRGLSERFRRPYEEFESGVRKQATIPEGAESLGLAGTAPGLVLEVDGERRGRVAWAAGRAPAVVGAGTRDRARPASAGGGEQTPTTGSSASSGCPSRQWPGWSSGPGERARASTSRSARTTSRCRSISSFGLGPRAMQTPSSERWPRRCRGRCSPTTSVPSRSSCWIWPGSRGSRSPRPRAAPEGSSLRDSPRFPARASRSRAASWPTTTA